MDIQLKYKIAMSKFRLSNNRLNIELGRCNNVPKENRVCNCCHQSNNANVVDSEYHAFFKCVNYYIVRQTYLFNWYVPGTELLCSFVFPKP